MVRRVAFQAMAMREFDPPQVCQVSWAVAAICGPPLQGALEGFDSLTVHQVSSATSSAWPEHSVWGGGVVGSNPSLPTKILTRSTSGICTRLLSGGQWVRVPPGQPNQCWCSSVGRALPCQGRCRGFESLHPLQTWSGSFKRRLYRFGNSGSSPDGVHVAL